MPQVKAQIEIFNKKLTPTTAKLVAVSKTKPFALIQEAYDIGQRDFGENKVQELQAKQPALASDIKWHMIGHLQRNKVKYIAGYIHLIHAVDSMKLLKEINKQAKNHDRVIKVLLQQFIAEEETKFGFSKEEILELLASEDLRELKNIHISGLMAMATDTSNQNQIEREFLSVSDLFNSIKNDFQLPNVEMKEISMGMSADYEIAVRCGATLIRIGSEIFGSRD